MAQDNRPGHADACKAHAKKVDELSAEFREFKDVTYPEGRRRLYEGKGGINDRLKSSVFWTVITMAAAAIVGIIGSLIVSQMTVYKDINVAIRESNKTLGEVKAVQQILLKRIEGLPGGGP